MRPNALVVTFALTLFANSAFADGWTTTWLPGAARAIPRTTSASRDAPLLEYAAGTYAMASLGLEPGLVTIQRGAPNVEHAFHLGFFGMAALQNATSDGALPNQYWRGLVGLTFTYAPTWVGRRLFGPGGDLELGFVLGHESDHRSDASSGLSLIDQASIYQNYVGADVGVRVPVGRPLTLVARVADRLDVGSLFTQVPAIDLELRLVVWRIPQPFLATHGEVLFTSDKTPSCPRARALAGVALVGKFGEVSPFAGLEGGCDEGLLYTRRDLRGEGGVRYAPF